MLKNNDMYVGKILDDLCNIIEEINHEAVTERECSKSFLEIGLTSADLVEMIERIDNKYHCSIGVEAVFDYDTPVLLAEHIEKRMDIPDLVVDEDSEIEKLVQNIVGKLLDISPKEVDLSISFLELGINSMLGVELMEELSERLQITLGPELLFDYFIPMELVEFLQSKKNDMYIKKDEIQHIDKEKDTGYVDENDIAVIGLSGRYGDCNSINDFWKYINEGLSGIKEIDRKGWELENYYSEKQTQGKSISKWAGLLNGIDRFDADFFGISEIEAKAMDPQQRILLEEAYHACEDSGYSKEALSGKNVGVFIGARASDYKELAIKEKDITVHDFLGNDMSLLASRLSYFFNFKGPSIQFDASCASSLVAIHQACESIHRGECGIALAGGVFVMPSPQFLVMNSQTGMLSPTGECKTYAEDANGTVIGEGVGVAILKSLGQALADHDHIYGVIKGTAMNQNGKTGGLTVPTSTSQKELINDLYSKIDISKESIDYIEIQGTGTPLGDPIEFKALCDAYQNKNTKLKSCAIGCHKSNIGHTVAAAGMAAFTKVLMALSNKQIPASVIPRKVNKNIDIEQSPFYFNENPKEWLKEGKRRAAINGFGFNGTNCHIVLEEAPKREKVNKAGGYELVLLSARTEKALYQKAKDLAEFISNKEFKASLKEIAYTLCVGRDRYKWRMSVICNSTEELLSKLENALQNINQKGVKIACVNEPNLVKKGSLRSVENTRSLVDKTTTQDALKEVAERFVKGEDIDWKQLFEEGVNRISLPLYPFERKSYWFDTSVNSELCTKREESNLNGDDEDKIIELIIQTILQKTNINKENISLDKPFLEYGMASMTAVEILEELNTALGTNMKATILFDYETIAKLANYIVCNYYDHESVHSVGVKRDDVVSARVIEEEKTLSYQPQSYNQSEDIAIIGMAIKVPKADNIEEFWNIIREGTDSITEVPSNRFDINKYFDTNLENMQASYCKQGGFCSNIDKFDPGFFNISGKEATLTDPQQRVMLEECYHALEDAGYAQKNSDGINCGVYLGTIGSDYYNLLMEQSTQLDPYLSLGNYNSILASRISYFLNLKGPSIAIDTACSSSMVAMHLACQAIQSGECSMALAGGVYFTITPRFFIAMSNMNAISPNGKCKAFDNNADGFVPGEGAGAIVLKKLSQARRDGDHIYAVIKGSNVNQDGKTNGITAPSVKSQEYLLTRTYEKNMINPENIGYYEAHGTGTKLGDPIEIEAITNAYRKFTSKNQYCAIGSVKANIGHAIAAAGIIGIIKLVLCMTNKKIPPQINFTEPNEHIDFKNSPLYVNTVLKDWNVEKGLRMGAVSSFGFSGTNAHVVIEEYRDLPVEENQQETEIVLISGKTEKTMKDNASNILGFLQDEQNHCTLKELAYTLQTAREHMKYRMAIIVNSLEELKQKLEEYIAVEKASNIYFSRKNETKDSMLMLFNDEDGKVYIEQLLNKKRLKKLAELWVEGIDVDFKMLYSKPVRKIHLPLYAFNHNKSYWSSNSLEVNEVVSHKKEADNLAYYHSIWKESNKVGRSQKKGTMVVFDKDDMLSGISDKWEKVIRVNESNQFRCDMVEKQVDLTIDREENYFELFEEIVKDETELINIIYLWSYEDRYDEKKFINRVLYENYDLEYLKMSTLPIYYITNAINRLNYRGKINFVYIYSGSIDKINPYNEMQMGFGTSIKLINPNLQFKTLGFIDCEPTTDEEIVSELDSEDLNIRYKEGKRYVQSLERR